MAWQHIPSCAVCSAQRPKAAIVSTIAGITRRRRFGAGVSGDVPKGRRSVRGTEMEERYAGTE